MASAALSAFYSFRLVFWPPSLPAVMGDFMQGFPPPSLRIGKGKSMDQKTKDRWRSKQSLSQSWGGA